jgi:hypothetical protein
MIHWKNQLIKAKIANPESKFDQNQKNLTQKACISHVSQYKNQILMEVIRSLGFHQLTRFSQ